MSLNLPSCLVYNYSHKLNLLTALKSTFIYSVQNVQKITTVTPELGKRHNRATNVTSLKWQQRNQDVMDCNYRLQTKFAKVMLLQVSVCLGGGMCGGGGGGCMAGGHVWQGGVFGRRGP